MTVKNYNKYLELSKVFNETFGAKNKMDNTVFTDMVRTRLIDETKVSVMYITVINLQREDQWLELSNKFTSDAVEIIRNYLKKATEEYKKNTGDKIKFIIDSKSVKFDVEFLTYNILRTNRNAYFRVYCDAEID